MKRPECKFIVIQKKLDKGTKSSGNAKTRQSRAKSNKQQQQWA